jgi:hypothetical protein
MIRQLSGAKLTLASSPPGAFMSSRPKQDGQFALAGDRDPRILNGKYFRPTGSAKQEALPSEAPFAFLQP